MYCVLFFRKTFWLIVVMTKNENDKNRVRVRKQNYGAHNRRVKQRQDAMTQPLAGSISKLFNAKSQKSLPSSQVEEPIEGVGVEDYEEPMNEGVASGEDHEASGEDLEIILDLEKDVDVNYDPGLWGSIHDTKRIMLVERGPIKI